MTVKALEYIEVDIDYCALTYGTAPCEAAIGVTGAIKCFNTLRTCQDRENFDNEGATIRFAKPTAYLPRSIACIPSVKSVSLTPAIISLGEDLGIRATLTVTFEDHRHSDTGPGFDKYVSERPYDPYKRGTFWGKWRARVPFVRGRSIRYIRGFLGQALGEMETRHYVIESFDGPNPQGFYTLIAKDVLKLADNDRAQAPLLSQGFLVGAIDNDDTSATLSPSGIGNAEYPASGFVAIGGAEICSFTRSGDGLMLTRAQKNTTAQSHAAGDRVQLCKVYTGVDAADIISDLLQNYAGVPSSHIPLAEWQAETETYLANVYTATIAEPVGVNQLVSELVEQAALAVWWDDLAQKIRLQVLRAVPTTADVFNLDNILEGSFRTREQPTKRLSQVWTYFAQRNPLKSLDDEDNYRSALVTVDLQAETDYGSAAIKKIFSRWVPDGGRLIAERLNNLQLGRFRDPPRLFSLDLFHDASASLGGGYQLQAHNIQDATGAASSAPVQVTRLGREVDKLTLEAEEALFTAYDPTDLLNRALTIDANTYNVNLRTMHDTVFPVPTAQDVIDGVNLTVTVETGVKVGSTSTALPALHVGTWPTGFPVTLVVKGKIQGCGGNGAIANTGSPNGKVGGPALYTRHAISLTDTLGQVWGGGGGGGHGATSGFEGASGGGGAGLDPGLPGESLGGNPASVAGTEPAGGAGGRHTATGFILFGGNGGGPGLAGGAGSAPPPSGAVSGVGGAAGSAVDGISFVTTVGAVGDRRGPTVN